MEFSLNQKQLNQYRENGFIKIKDVFTKNEIKEYEQQISKHVLEYKKQHLALEKRDTYGKAFLQMTNLWQKNSCIKKLVLSSTLGSIATQLLETEGVRLYHDQALYKEAGGGITPWHADQYYWPLSSDKTITAWIPLQETPLEMGPLEFSAGSKSLMDGRALKISDESERIIGEKLRITDFEHVVEPYGIGEISFHSGWTFHRAGANKMASIRKVMTIIYMDKDMVLKAPVNENQQSDWETWCPGASIGEVINTPMNPVIFERTGRL